MVAHLSRNHGKVNFRLTKANSAKLEKVAEELAYPRVPPYITIRTTKQSVLTHILNQFFRRYEEDQAGFRELVESRRHGTKICIHLDLRLRYALWRAKRILKISQNELVNLAIECYVLKGSLPESGQKREKVAKNGV